MTVDQTGFNPWNAGRRIKAIVGHYGSGKTEIALNLALDAKAQGRAACIVDLDIVNPFFRSAEQHQLLEEHGVELIYPPYALTGVDLPVLPPEVARVFVDPSLRVVLDVGGDDAGAAALGGYKQHFERESADLWYVVNLYRPFSETKQQIIQMLERIARRARIAPTGLINNANLADWTEPEHLLECQHVLAEVSRETGVPIVMITGKRGLLDRLPKDIGAPLYPISRYLKLEWMDA